MIRNLRFYSARVFVAASVIVLSPVFGWAQNFGNPIQQPTAQPGAAPMQATQSAQGQVQGGQPQEAKPVQAGQVPTPPMGNAPFVLTQQEQSYLDDVLKFWQLSTSKIDRFECKFARWQFDPTKVNNPNEFYTASSGVIRYMKPDKGMFQVEDLRYRVDKPDGKVAYEALPGHFGEWWICDGVSVHEYDRTEKKVTKYPLPPNMRGAEVFNSPLPFVFGIDAEKIKQRYWVRPLPHPVDNEGKPNTSIIVIEAYPQLQSDALNYHHVTIYLDRAKFLPQALEIALTQWTPQAPHREVFEFKDRETDTNLLQKITPAIFQKAFIPEAPPKDWTVIEKPFIPEGPVEGLRAENANPGQNPVPGNDGLRAANPNQLPPNGLQR